MAQRSLERPATKLESNEPGNGGRLEKVRLLSLVVARKQRAQLTGKLRLLRAKPLDERRAFVGGQVERLVEERLDAGPG